MKEDTLAWVAAFYSERADYPLRTLPPDYITVVGSDNRRADARLPSHRRCALWMAVMSDRCLVSTQHELAGRILDMASTLTPKDLLEQHTRDQLVSLCQSAGNEVVQYAGLKLFCDAEMYVPVRDANVKRLTSESAPEAIRALRPVGIPWKLDYLLAEGTAFAYYLEGKPVAFAATHRSGKESDRIGNVMVGTLEQYRRRGYGKAVISATTRRIAEQGKVAVWGMAEDNVPALKTAESVGYRLYCTVFELRFASKD